MEISKIVYEGRSLRFKREYNAVFVTFPGIVKKRDKKSIEVFYSGYPHVSKDAPHERGFVVSKDKNGKQWLSVMTEGMGASSWWPCKDHQSDEADSVLMSISVPKDLKASPTVVYEV